MLGETNVKFVNGTAQFTDLAISHGGTGYELTYHVTYPLNVSFSHTHGGITITERQLDFRFTSNITTTYDGVDIKGLPSVAVYDKILGM